MMDATELAHWRYRVKALLRDEVASRNTLSEFCSSGGLVFPYDYVQEATTLLESQLALEQWLLEEARYKVELGEIAVPPVPHLEAGTTGTAAEIP